MSTTPDLKAALQYCASEKPLCMRVHTKSFMTRGCDISFLSAFPSEREHIYPPLTFVMPKGNPHSLRVGDADITIIDVEPFFAS